MVVSIQIVFYSMYGHVYRRAEAVAEGPQGVSDTKVTLFPVPELVPMKFLKRAEPKRRAQFPHIPIAQIDKLPQADAIIFGMPTRYGTMASQLRNFLDQTGGLWMKGAPKGKVGSVFCSTAIHPPLLHLSMVVVGLAYAEQRLWETNEISGGTSYGALTLAGGDAFRRPSENELAIARCQGKHVAEITKPLFTKPLLVRGRQQQG